jgi:hypothetical protein
VDRQISSSDRGLRAWETANIVTAISPAAVRGEALTLRVHPRKVSCRALLFLGRKILAFRPYFLPLFTNVPEEAFSEVRRA